MSLSAPLATAVETVTDEALLRRYTEFQDPEAFTELAHRHAGLVFGACLRITADRHDAEELTQECFFQLARKATTIRSSVAGWLHQIATHRALNAVRSRGRRRTHEAQAGVATTSEAETRETAWREVEPLLDEAVDGLPTEVRDAIILHFLKSLPQSEVADRLGVHQSTVSRRIGQGLKLLHERLQTSGVVMAATPLSALLTANATPDGLPDLASTLGKIALTGAGSGAAGGLFGWLGFSWFKLKAWVMLTGATILPIIVQLVAGGWFGFLVAVLIVAYVAWRRPAWVEELSLEPGGVYSGPFFPFGRWTWTTPPPNWRERMFASLAAGLMMGGMGWAMTQSTKPSPGMSAMFLTYALIAFSTAARIMIRVLRFRSSDSRDETAENAIPTPDGITVLHSVCAAAVSPFMVISLALFCLRTGQPRSYAFGLLIPMTIGVAWAIIDSVYKVSRYRRALPTPLGDACERNASSARPSKSTTWVLVVVLAYAVFFTAIAMTEALELVPMANAYRTTSAGIARHAVAIGVVPSLSLLFLTHAIRPFGRTRDTMRPALWLFLIAVAMLCGMLNLGLCITWLMPRS